MRIHALVQKLFQFHPLNAVQEENLSQLLRISQKFHVHVGLPFPESPTIHRDTIVLESGHQPNFIPYPGVWKKAFLLDLLVKELRASGRDAVAVFGFADYNLSTAPYLSQNHIPALNKQGNEPVGFKIKEKDRWKGFHTLEKPSGEQFGNEAEKIARLYRGYTKKLNPDGKNPEIRIDGFLDLFCKSYESSHSFSEMNASLFAWICSEIFRLEVLFFTYTDIQRDRLFIDTSRSLLTDLSRFRTLSNQAIAETGFSQFAVQEDDVPFWYYCDCGGNVKVTADSPSCLKGRCPVCEKEYTLPLGPGLRHLDSFYPRMSLNAVARNIIVSEGLGTTLFISGVGGSLRYGLVADTISREMGFHRPLTLAWRSRDRYFGPVHHLSLQELSRTFGFQSEDLANGTVNGRIRDHCSALYERVKTLQDAGGDKREMKRIENTAVQARNVAMTVKNIFSITPSLLDLLIACEPGQILDRWREVATESEIHRDGRFLTMMGDIFHPCDPGSHHVPHYSPDVYRIMETLEGA